MKPCRGKRNILVACYPSQVTRKNKKPATCSKRPATHYKFTYYHTGYGVGALIFSDCGLAGLILPTKCEEEIQKEVLRRFPAATCDNNKNTSLAKILSSYFRGEKVKFNQTLDLVDFSPFEREVFQTVCTIPYGETRTYKWVAEVLAKPRAYRAIGKALGRNPIPIVVPCHRVVKSDGELGGFSAGVWWKKELLKLEGYLGDKAD
ncbi:MAG: methylated-DNA--[protein]-cysteine S-methyltransferase [Actinomycetota bacterium]|nr:methylated-DNA--[protein]-cysteine S-methyltransferase [Actinomycetota bacterium]